MPKLTDHLPLSRGVSLVEALVAMAVMSIGMLALVGVQSTMRMNSDLARQRTEATRIASEEIERMRSFTAIAAVPGTPGVSYDELASRVVEGYQPPGGIANTTYRVVRNVLNETNSAQKVVQVQVQWTDRTNQPQTVTLDSIISATDPRLGAMLLVPHRETASSRNRGRHVSIPVAAVPVEGDSTTSRFSPPGGSVTWYFNNLTGVMRVCAPGITDYATCPLATLVSGSVRFHVDAPANGAAAEHPNGSNAFRLAAAPHALRLDAPFPDAANTSAQCYSQAIDQRVDYFCSVTTNSAAGWGGVLNVQLVDHPSGIARALDGLAAGYRSCRYTNAVPTVGIQWYVDNPNAEFTPNGDHPLKYCREKPLFTVDPNAACTGFKVKSNLINQNFLVIKGNQTCPKELNDDANRTPNGEGTDPLILANTRQHQPTP